VSSFERDGSFRIRCDTRGVIRSRWHQDDVGGGDYSLNALIRSAMPFHKELLSDRFSYNGPVLLAQANRWRLRVDSDETRSIRLTYPDAVLVDDLDSGETVASLERQVKRDMGYWTAEP
jgi:hypothetical protein